METHSFLETVRAFKAFLYRRCAGLVTCQVELPGRHPLALDSKFQVNSLQDVFFHPFYWQLFHWVDKPPALVVDLGAHCGHFSMLADVCFQLRFKGTQPEYLLVEPNPQLLPVIRRNLARSGLCPHYELKHGVIGKRTGTTTLWVSPHNFLSASLQKNGSGRGVSVEYLDLDQLVGNRQVDLLKIDIEEAEYEFARNYPKLLQGVQRLMIEIHAAPDAQQQELLGIFEQAGLHMACKPLEHAGFQLAMLHREGEGIA
ncbi:MAG: FkbM family methyltransferase [Limisphaerales bacterium]